MSVMLATDVTVLDTIINRVVQEGDSVSRIGTGGALEPFQGLVEGDPFMAVIGGQQRTMAEYGLVVSVLFVCACALTWQDGQAFHAPGPDCRRPAYWHI